MANDIEIKLNSSMIPQVKAEVAKRGLVALEKCGLMAENYAKRNCTEKHIVDTGALRNSITHIVDESEPCVYIGTNIEYGVYIELGTGIYAENGDGRKTAWAYKDANGNWHKTKGQKPRPYIRPAITEHMDVYKKLIKDTFSE